VKDFVSAWNGYVVGLKSATLSMPKGFGSVRSIEQASMLGRAAALTDVGDVAAFVASDRARTHDRRHGQYQQRRTHRLALP
jgi:hypothetical protein